MPIARHILRTGSAVLVTALLPSLVAAQPDTHRAITAAPLVGSTLPAEVTRDLPLGDNVYAALETTQPEVIADRFNSGGLNTAQDARVGGFLGSWSQTLFRIGDLNVSDPSGSGASLLFPSLLFWDELQVTTGMMPVDMNTPGLGVSLRPLRPGSSWTRSVAAFGSGGSLAAGAPVDQPPPIARLRDWASGSAIASGPLSPSVGLVAGASFTGGSHFVREQLADTRDSLVSGFAHIVFSPSVDRDFRTLVWVQHGETPFDNWQAFQQASATTGTTAVHVQSTFESTGATQWRVFGGLTQRTRTNEVGATSAIVERITDGPVPQLVDTVADSTARRVAVGGRFTPNLMASTGGQHRVELGVDGELASTDRSHAFTGTVRELVNGVAGRIWTYSAPAGESQRSVNTLSGFASDTIALAPWLTLDAGVRLESVRGRADGAATAVNWLSLLPHAYLRVGLGSTRALRFGYARSANALNQNWLAFGDPAAPTATVASAAKPGTIVSRVGPGTGGNPAFSGIDPDLKRPVTDEFVIGFEKRRSSASRYTLTAIARRETNMLGVVNTGVTSAGYSAISIPDAGVDWAGAQDDRPLVVYNRLPATFGQDAYLVTNPEQQAATAFALRVGWEHASDRLFVLFGATASAANGSVSNPGYGPTENDQDQPGDLFTNPNAASYARGRLFSDRAFTIKWTTMYHFPGGWTAGGIARYQDGQPFARMVVVPGLNQGTEAVQAYPNAGSRFMFTGTFDLRVQKRFTIGAAHLDAILDAYNLLTRSNEVEEYVVSDPALFRQPTAIEPPHAVHIGLRLTF